jgi:hypothetical protein
MKKQFLIASFVFLLIAIFSCKESIITENSTVTPVQSVENRSNNRESAEKPDEEMVLGKQLQNPYTVENMKTAYNNLKKLDNTIAKIDIKANYLYLKFLPKTDEEYDILDKDDNLDLYSYPLDYEISKNGNKFKDPTTYGNKFTWYYAVVPIDYALPKQIKTEVLSKLYLPRGNGNAKSPEKIQKQVFDNSLIDELENEALRITGNLKSSKNGKIASYVPTGRIRVWDERIRYNDATGTYVNGAGYVPVVGCKVRTRRWFSTETTLTLNDGSFNIGVTYNNPANYSIEWDRADFDIRDGSYGQAYFNGPKQEGRWDLNIERNGDSFLYAHVHRAAWNYYYNNTFGVNSPPSVTFASLGGEKMHLGTKQGTGRSHYFQFNGTWLASQVKLIFDLSRTDHDARYVFATTIHELTHASHWAMGMSYAAYCSNAGQAGRMAESWAQAVGWHITRIVYAPNNPTNNILDDVDNTQLTSLTAMNQTGNCITDNGPWYTPLFIDLIDNYNQVINGSNRPNDQANGYTITQLQSFLMARPTNWYMYRDYLESNSNNATETAAIQLFSDYD